MKIPDRTRRMVERLFAKPFGYVRPGPYYYKAARRVPKAQRRAGEAMLAYVQHDLNLPELELRWGRLKPGMPPGAEPTMTVSSPTEVHGGTFLSSTPNVIWVQPVQSPYKIAQTVAHEARHAWQRRCRPQDFAELKVEELDQDADDYAQRATRAPSSRQTG